MVVVSFAVGVGRIGRSTEKDLERRVNLRVQSRICGKQPAAGNSNGRETRIAGDILGHQSAARKSIGCDLRRVEASVVRAARLVVLGDGPGDVVEHGLSVLPAAAGVGSPRRAICDDEVALGGELAHRGLIRESVLGTAALSPDEDRVLLGALHVCGPEDGAALDPCVGIRLDDHFVRPTARHRLARVFGHRTSPSASARPTASGGSARANAPHRSTGRPAACPRGRP